MFPDARESRVAERSECLRMGSSSGSGDLSQKRRSDCKRNVSNHPEHNKLKVSRGGHPQRRSHHVENQVMVKSPSCWTDPFQAELDKRHTTKITRTAEPLSRDVIELKQAALWHVGKVRIDQASEAAAEGMLETTESTPNLISIRRDPAHHPCCSSRARDFIADFASTIMHIIVVRSGNCLK